MDEFNPRLSTNIPAQVPPHASGSAALRGIPSLPSHPNRRAFHSTSPEAVAQYWVTSLVEGLPSIEAQNRLQRLGENKLTEKPGPSLFARFLAQVSDFTVLALLGAAALAAGLSIFAPEPGQSLLARFGDSFAILLIVILNAVLGLAQERQAEKALRAMRDMTAPSARVLRDGKVVEISSTSLVPGDVVLLEEGDRIAADLRLFSAADLEVEEASLTGESSPVGKDATLLLEPAVAMADRLNMCFMGTRVVRGRARGVVCNTGMQTELGSIAGMLAAVELEDTPLQQQLARFGKQVVLGCIAVSVVVFFAGWPRDIGRVKCSWSRSRWRWRPFPKGCRRSRPSSWRWERPVWRGATPWFAACPPWRRSAARKWCAQTRPGP